MAAIYIMFDVDCDVKVLDKEPIPEHVIGWYDGRFIKVEDGKVYASLFDESVPEFVWKEVEIISN